MSNPMTREERALLGAYRAAAGPDAASIARIRAQVTAEVEGARRPWHFLATAAAIAAVALGAWFWSNSRAQNNVSLKDESAKSGDRPLDSGGHFEPGSATAGSPEGSERKRSPSTWRERLLERVRARQEKREQSTGPKPGPRNKRPGASRIDRRKQGDGPGSKKGERETQTDGPRDSNGRLGLGGRQGQRPNWRSPSETPGEPAPKDPRDQDDPGRDTEGEDSDDTDDDSQTPGSPEEACEQGRGLCLEGADEITCRDEYANCLIDFACEAFRRDQCLTEFSEEDCQLELQHCHERPEEYFWEVCRFRLNECTETDPVPDSCEQKTSACFDAAEELFGPEPS